MLYSAVRSFIAILLITPLLASAKVRSKFRTSLGMFLAYIGSIIAVSIALSFWPFENYFGGFDSIEQAMKYEHGEVTIQDTIETDTSILVFSDKTLDMIFKKDGSYYLNINSNLTQTIGLSKKGYYVTIYRDLRDKQSYVEITVFEWHKKPTTITDNKGSKIEERFNYNGLIYFLGTFAYDDGSAYKLYIDGEDIRLVMRD